MPPWKLKTVIVARKLYFIRHDVLFVGSKRYQIVWLPELHPGPCWESLYSARQAPNYLRWGYKRPLKPPPFMAWIVTPKRILWICLCMLRQ